MSRGANESNKRFEEKESEVYGKKGDHDLMLTISYIVVKNSFVEFRVKHNECADETYIFGNKLNSWGSDFKPFFIF